MFNSRKKFERLYGIEEGRRRLNYEKALVDHNNDEFGLLSTLFQQSGNGSSVLKARTFFNGVTTGRYQGTWSAVAPYNQYDIVGYPSDVHPLRFRANQSILAGQSPDTHPAKWDLQVGVEFLQDLGLGNYARYSLGVRNDAMTRLNGLDVGTFATSSFTRRESNYTGNGASANIGTANTSFATPSSHPSSRTLPTQAGLAASLPNSETLPGTCNDTFSIPSVTPTFLTLTLPTGLTLTKGETITLYGNTNNFVVIIVGRYNSSTGAFYGASTNSVGSGSFSSWTIKREKLVYIFDTTDATGKNFYGLVQTYDNGTGSLVVNSVANTSSITNADWTIALGKVPANPTSSLSTFFNNSISTAYAVGHWFLGSFTGDRLVIRSEKDNRGMDWQFVYLHGDNDVIPADVTVSTYNASALSSQLTTVFTGLKKGTHFFMAVSKAAASGTNTRAWINADTDAGFGGFLEQYEYDVFTPTVTLGASGAESFGEIAYSFRDSDGGDTSQWVPEHSNVLTSFFTSKSLTIDGVAVSMSDENALYMNKFRDITSAQFLQTLDIQHPQSTGSMGTFNVTHTFDKNGLYYKTDILWAKDGVITTGYNNMVFLAEAWFNKILCEDNQAVNRPGNNTVYNLSATEQSQRSYLFYSTGADPLNKFVLALAFPNKTRDWRIGQADRGTPQITDFSGTANAKFYPHVYSGYAFTAGERMISEGRLYAGNKGNLVLA